MKKVLISLGLLLTLCFVLASAHADEIVLADTDNVCIKVKSMETSGDTFNMKLYLENKSNVTAMFTIEKTVANGYVADPFWATEIAPGKKANEVISIYRLSDNGIADDVSIIEFDIRAYDSNDWMADNLFKQRFTLYPLGEDKATIKEREVLDTDTVIADTKDVTIIATGYDVDRIWGYTARIYLENKTDKTLMFTCEDVSVNGFMIDPFWATEIPPHARSYNSISWSSSSFEENDIEEVEEIEITFRAYDSDDWMADNTFKKTVILKP